MTEVHPASAWAAKIKTGHETGDAVLRRLAARADEAGFSSPHGGVSALAGELGLTPRTVRRWLADLEARQFLLRLYRRFDSGRKAGLQGQTVYLLAPVAADRGLMSPWREWWKGDYVALAAHWLRRVAGLGRQSFSLTSGKLHPAQAAMTRAGRWAKGKAERIRRSTAGRVWRDRQLQRARRLEHDLLLSSLATSQSFGEEQTHLHASHPLYRPSTHRLWTC